ncbi:MAG: RNase J family beta-CASP ribonuclease, partial [Lachnospiraceae bacterium]
MGKEINPLKAIKKIKELNDSLSAKDENGKDSEKGKSGRKKEAAKVKEDNLNTDNKKNNSMENEKAALPVAKPKRKIKSTESVVQESKEKEAVLKESKKAREEALLKSVEEQLAKIALDKNKKVKSRTEVSIKKQAITRKKTKKNNKKIKIIPLGGLEQIGMNITAFEYENSIFIVDCGLAFPSDDMLGIDLVIPDVSYLKNNFSKLKGFCITHGHEDHIGALPYILKQLNIPVYGTRLTIALIERKLKEHNIDKMAKLNVVKYGETVEFGDFKVEFVKTNHSIADAAALAIFSPAGVVFHTGDFKVDYTPVFGDAVDLQRMADIGREGCLALMCDSTNATKPGFTMSEKTVGKTFDAIFAENQKNRILVATFASNVDRVQQIINTAYKYGRKVVVEGRSMVNVISVAGELGYINIPKGTLIDVDSIKNYPPESTVIITTGSQGESMAALSRMASSIHKKVTIMPGDVVIMSSTPIPGNEKAVSKVINELSIKGANVIFQDTHVSGHACQEEIKLMYALLKPKFALPVHGEYRHLMAQKELAVAMGMEKDNVLLVSSGDVVELGADSIKVVDRVEAGGVFVDGLGVGDVGNIVLRDRQNLAQNGIIIVALSLEKGSNQLLSGPDIVSRGFVYVRESGDLMEEATEVVRVGVDDCLAAGVSDWSKIKNIIRDTLSDFLWKRIKRNPV